MIGNDYTAQEMIGNDCKGYERMGEDRKGYKNTKDGKYIKGKDRRGLQGVEMDDKDRERQERIEKDRKVGPIGTDKKGYERAEQNRQGFEMI